MTTTAISTITISSSDSKGSAVLQYNTSTLVQSSPIEITYIGNKIKFATVADFTLFMAEIIAPLSNKINSVSGAGAGYDAITLGTAGTDAVHN